MIAPRVDRVEITNKMRRKKCSQRLAIQLRRKAVGQVLKHHQANEKRVPRSPRRRLVAQQAKLKRQMSSLRRNGCVDAGSIALKQMQFIGRKSSESTVRGSSNLQRALGAVVRNQRRSENLCQIPGCVTTQRVHLPQSVLRGHVALSHHKIVE